MAGACPAVGISPGDSCAFVIGTSSGLVAGYVGARSHRIIAHHRLFYAFPSVLLAIAISGVLARASSTPSFPSTVVSCRDHPCRESVTTGVRTWIFVEAARASGAAPSRSCACTCRQCIAADFRYADRLISVSMNPGAGLSFLASHQTAGAGMGFDANTLRTAIYINPWVAGHCPAS